MRTVAVVTGSRSDYGCLLPVIRKIRETPELKLHLMVTGMHLLKEFGQTVKEIEQERIPIAERVDAGLLADSPEGIAESMGRGGIGFSRAFARLRPDLLVVLGDRFEMHAAALAALPFKIPVAHIHGGELSLGAMDDALRHSMTKLSHLHFTATEEAAHRVIQMGEEPWRVLVTGAPALDLLGSVSPLSREELSARIGLDLKRAPLLVTFHPVTLEFERTEWQVGQLLKALRESGLPAVFTAPNADTHGRVIRRKIEEFVSQNPLARWVPHLGCQAYWGLMREAAAVVGNSSSGIVEAASLGVPVVNVGTRQQGRTRAENVIDVGYAKEEILAGVRRALSPEFRKGLAGRQNPYGDGQAARRIVQRLKEVPINDELIRKRFIDSTQCLILGGGGHARVLVDALRASGAGVPMAILDSDRSLWGKDLLGVPIAGGDDRIPEFLRQGVQHFVVGLGGVGDNRPRRRLFEAALAVGLTPLTVIHPSAVCSPFARVGAGSVLFPKAVVNAGAILGVNVIVNTGAVVEHDCPVGDHAHIAPGALISGGVRVEPMAHVGAGATVRQGITLGEGAVVGVGAAVVEDVRPWTVVAGVPAKLLKNHVDDKIFAGRGPSGAELS